MLNPHLFIKEVGAKGKGVFTRENIPADSIIEIAPVIVMKKADRFYLDKTLLHDYIFEWGADLEQCCLALGFVSMYNHSYESNCEYFMNFEEENIFVKTVRTIEAGSELTINYNGDWNDGNKVWFNTL